MTVKPNQVVTINYTLKDEEGTVIDSTQKDQPFTYLSGSNQILPKLEENINSMLIGTKKVVILKPDEAYGVYNEKAVESVDRTEFPADVEVEEGMSFMAHTPDGKNVPLTIVEVDGNNIKVDFNHPLAGVTLEFDVELLDIRNATPDELAHGHAHGPDGHHHH